MTSSTSSTVPNCWEMNSQSFRVTRTAYRSLPGACALGLPAPPPPPLPDLSTRRCVPRSWILCASEDSISFRCNSQIWFEALFTNKVGRGPLSLQAHDNAVSRLLKPSRASCLERIIALPLRAREIWGAIPPVYFDTLQMSRCTRLQRTPNRTRLIQMKVYATAGMPRKEKPHEFRFR